MKLFYKKSLFFSVLMLGVILFANCGKAMWGGLDYNSLNVKDEKVIKVFETAKANDKYVMLVFDAVWCGYCRKFNTITMKDAEVQKTLEDFEIFNIDIDKFPEVAETFNAGSASKGGKGIPGIMIFASDGIQIDEINGYAEPEYFNELLKMNL